MSDGQSLGVISWLKHLSGQISRLSAVLGELESTGLVKFIRNSSDNIIDTIVIHDLIQSFIRAKIPRQDMVENVAAALLLNGKACLTNGIMKDYENMRSHSHRTQEQLVELLDAADVDFKLGYVDNAIEKYVSVTHHCDPGMAEKDDIMVRASASLREAREIHARRERDFQRAILTQRSTKSTPEELNETTEVEDGEWEILMRYEEALNLFGPRDSETLQHAAALATYYKDIARTDKEEVYREIVWRYYTTSAGESHPATVATLYDLCVCYRENGKLRDKLRGDLYLAPVWARTYKSSELQSLLLEVEAPDVLAAFNNGNEDTFWNLVNRHDTNAAIFWASDLENLNIRDMLFYHFAKTNMPSVCLFLHLTSDSGQGSAFKKPSKWDLDVYQSDIDSTQALQHAVRRSYISIVQGLLENGVDTSYADSYGLAAIHYAVKRRDLLMVLMLLEHRADISQSDSRGRTALHYAVREKHISIIKSLLENGANADQKDNYGETSLHYAVKDREPLLALVLLEHRADISEADSHGRTALHYAVRGRDTVILKSLLENGAQTYQRDNHGETALHYAARGRDVSKIYLLLKHGADISLKDNHGETPLHYAARVGRMTSVQALLKFGGDTTQRDNDGKTALHYGMQAGLALFQMLLEYGGEVSQADNRGRVALHYAARDGFADIAKAILNRGIDTEATDYCGNTPLHLAARGGNHESTRLLLEMKANSFAENALGNTALELAFHGGFKNTVELILTHTLDKRDPQGQTFLHRAASNRDCVGLFYSVIEISHDIINATDNSGRTALHIAAARGNLFAVQMLLDNGANNQIQSNEGHTPLADALLQRTVPGGTSKSDLALEEVIRLLHKAGSGIIKDVVNQL
ncbi:hypothetical protein EYZ11_003788 [Aspergillus tanneri]|uniref:Uncharacterized protein n=1 Tax=Aspergillus tanneri TaxID=1220188 RepID=A0A4S3JMS4_9EURO|nr:hypothetical protein EYZ11_003788 [Aspergillus tanneri]